MNRSLEEYLEKEAQLKDIDSYTIFGDIPIWRIVRSRIRGELLNRPDKTVAPQISWNLITNVIISFFQLLKLIIFRKQIENVIFPHPRLYKIGDRYIERLTDPLIEYSNIRNSYIIFERWQNGTHRKPRIHSDKCDYWDFIPFVSLLVSRFLVKLLLSKYRDRIKGVIDELKKEFEITPKINSIINHELASFIISYKLSSPILKACSPKRVFLAPRTTFNYVIAFCKIHGIVSYELQHGITLGSNKLYSGKYNDAIDPDYFLIFGKDNNINHFGIPEEKIINIGFAYRNYLKEFQIEPIVHKRKILVISDPGITEPLICTVHLLAKKYPDWDYDFRCHPQEALNKEHKKLIANTHNMHEVSNTEESFSTINKYPIIIGENSSVIFEALYLGKKVGRLNFNGLKVNTDSEIIGGVIINSIEEFGAFLDDMTMDIPSSKQLYSDFLPDVVNNLD